ncbi:MAG: T9SS type A sorting domain-containing protein, partial [Calditrichaeota bacterium]|nr:T9SS type A sorting domain-containing protein [Calditrichota bacterium]
EIILDDSDAESYTEVAGTWKTKPNGSSFYKGWNGEARVSYNNSSRAQWHRSGVVGTYRVWAYWGYYKYGGDSQAKYQIHHSGGVAEHVVDQKAVSQQWVLLGEYTFNGDFMVEIRAVATPIVADAVKLEAVGLAKNGSNGPQEPSVMVQDVPVSFEICAPYPNPFNMETKIKLEIPESGLLFAAIYNIRGQKLITLSDDQVMAGEKVMLWNGRDEYGSEASSGIYLLKVVYRGENQQRTSLTKRLILMK